MIYMEITTTIKDDIIRHHFDEKSGKWYFSVVDVIAIITKSSDPRNYWKVLKNRLKKAQNKLVTECNQLKMLASDGKYYLTDVADEETILDIVKLISEEYVFPFRLWFDNLEQKQSPHIPQESFLRDYGKSRKKSYPQSVEEELMLMVNGYYEKDIIVIQTFVAGVDVENILISVTCKTITIKGERIEKKNSEEYLCKELYWGKFSRIITLPEEIEINQVEISEHYGLLTIKLPIINKNRSKLVRVKAI